MPLDCAFGTEHGYAPLKKFFGGKAEGRTPLNGHPGQSTGPTKRHSGFLSVRSTQEGAQKISLESAGATLIAVEGFQRLSPRTATPHISATALWSFNLTTPGQNLRTIEEITERRTWYTPPQCPRRIWYASEDSQRIRYRGLRSATRIRVLSAIAFYEHLFARIEE
jgi:hypothetical protein